MSKEILTEENIQLHVNLSSKEEAIKRAGNILVQNGYVNKGYISKMLEREKVTSTYIGNSIAIPHGTENSRGEVLETGISIVTVPNGVDFGENNIAKVIIGIAGKGDEHLELLSKIAIVCSEEENVEKIVASTSKEQIIQLFSEVN